MTCAHVDTIRIRSRTPAFDLTCASEPPGNKNGRRGESQNQRSVTPAHKLEVEGPDMSNACPASELPERKSS